MSGPYRLAQLRARQAAGQLSAVSTARVGASVAEMAERLERQLAALPVGSDRRAALQAAARITRDAKVQLDRALLDAVQQNRGLAFEQVYRIWDETGRRVATTAGVPAALFGGIRTPNLTMAGAYEALGGAASTWRSSLTTYTTNGFAEIDRVIRHGLVEGVAPGELARRLRPYVQGAEEFGKAFPKADERFAALHDFRTIPPDLKGAARKVRINATRIAFTETHNARAEAELQAFAVDPMVHAVQWELSPFRGQIEGPDECDGYAKVDWYGLGPGVFPLDAVPVPPHPHDRCERTPVLRRPEQMDQPKPTGLPLRVDPSRVKIPQHEGQPLQTAQQRDRLRERLANNFRAQKAHPAGDALQRVLRDGDRQATELLRTMQERRAAIGIGLPPPPPPPVPPPGLPVPVPVPGPPPPPAALTGTELRDKLKTLGARQASAEARVRRALVPIEDQLNAIEGERIAWRAKAGWNAPPHEFPRHQERERLAQRAGALRMRIVASRNAQGRLAEQVVRAPSPSTVAVTFEKPPRDKAWAANVNRGVERFRQIVGDRHLAGESLVVKKLRTGARAFYRQSERAVNLATDTQLRTVVHELAHGLEYNSPGVLQKALAFRARRTVGERPVRLRDLYRGAGYKADEITLKDNFGWYSWYVGKVYEKGGVDYATEIISMGVELLAADPVRFAASDPEYFDFIIDLLWHN